MKSSLASPAAKRDFMAMYPETSNVELASRFGVSVVTISKWAGVLGLKKSPQYRSLVQRRNATGRILSDESRAKLRARAQGRKLSEATKAKILQTKHERGTLPAGEKHYKWKGGKPWERFKDPAYQAWRNAVLERDGYICQQCHRRCKKYERGLAAHHLKDYANHPELRLDVANGITLCRACHLALHGKAPSPKPPVPCACGCGTLIPPYDPYGRPRRFVNHHACRGRRMSESAKEKLRKQRSGKTLTPEHRNKISAGLRRSAHRVGRPPKA